jgi:SAM-dependent methyltransferase
MAPLDRDSVLAELQTHKTRIAVPVEQVQAVDRRLERDWGIVFPDNGVSTWEDLVAADADPAAVARFRRAHDVAAAALRGRDRYAQVRSLAALYDVLVHPAVLGPVTSQRRHFIIDSIAAALGLSTHLHLDRIIDIGCHAGTITSVLASELGRRVVGVDPSPIAIEYARLHAPSGCEFSVAAVPFTATEQFDLVIAVDSLPDDDRRIPAFAQGVAGLLAPSGVALIVSQYWASQADDLSKYFWAAGLGFGYADVVGGLGGIPPAFDAEGMVVLLKGGKRTVPQNIRSLMENKWGHFRQYADTAGTPLREKTQAFERALRRRQLAGK